MVTVEPIVETSPKAFDLSPYSPDLDELNAQESNEESSTSLGLSQSLQKEDDLKATEESNLLGDFIQNEEWEKEESSLSKSQRLVIYNKVEDDPESSDEEIEGEGDIAIEHDEKNDIESSWVKDHDWSQEYTGLEEEDETYEWVDFQHEHHSVDSFENFETNAFQQLSVNDGNTIPFIKNEEEMFNLSDVGFEDMVQIQPRKIRESKVPDPMTKFAKNVPLIKAPPAEKVAAYLDLKRSTL